MLCILSSEIKTISDKLSDSARDGESSEKSEVKEGKLSLDKITVGEHFDH